MNRLAASPRGRAGRPTKAQMVARHSELLEAALNHFLDKGFEGATIEAIAAEVQMTKRTIYTRYPDKESLFLAAVLRAIEHNVTSAERLRAVVTDDLAQTLANIARLRIDQVMTPNGLRLQRVVNTESYRFPEIFGWYYQLSARPVIDFLAELLGAEVKAGRLAIIEPETAANLFVTMVISAPVRALMTSAVLSSAEIDERIRAGVHLFLYGALPR